jgi:hypothetical protein
MLNFLKIIVHYINIALIWLALVCLAFLMFILLEIPIPFATKYTISYIEKNYPNLFANNNYVNINSISLSWNASVNRPIILVKNIDYIQDGIILNFNSIGFYPSIKTLLNEGSFAVLKLYINGVSLDFSEDKTENPKTLEDFLNFINNKPYQAINDFLQKNKTLSLLNQIAANNLKVVAKYKTDTAIFNIDLIDVSFNDTNKTYFAKLNTQILINQNQISFGDIKLESKLSINNSFLNKVEFKEINLAQIYNYANALKLIQNNDFLKNIIINNLVFSINGDFTYLKTIKNANFNFNLNQSSLDLSKALINIVKKPTEINYAKFNVIYNADNSTILLNNFDADFKSFEIENTNLALPLLIKKLQYTGSVNVNDNTFLFYGTNYIENLENSIVLNFTGKKDLENKFNLSLKTSINKVAYSSILKNWPEKFLPKVKFFLKENLESILVDRIELITLLNYKNSELMFNDIKLNLDASNVVLTYLKGLPKLKAQKASVLFSNNITTITYQNTTTGNLNVSSGDVKFFNDINSKNKDLMLSVNLNATGLVEDTLNYLNNKPLNLIEKTGLIKSDLNGIVESSLVYLLYNLDTIELEDLLVRAKLKNFSFNKIFKDISINQGKVDLEVTLKNLKAQGNVNYLSNNLSFNILYNFYETDNKFKYQIASKNIRIGDVENLNIIPDGILNKISTIGELNLSYYQSKNINFLDFKVDLKDSIVDLEYLNFLKLDGDPFLVSGLMQIDNNNFTIDNLNILGIDIAGNIMVKHFNIENDISEATKTDILIKKLILKDKVNIFGDLSFIISSNNQNSINANIKGSYLDVSYFINYYKNSSVKSKNNESILSKNIEDTKKTIENKADNKTQKYSYNINMNVGKIITNQYFANNFNIKIVNSFGVLSILSINTNFNNSKDSYIVFDDLTNQLTFKINNAGYFLEMFNLSKDIKGGELNGEVLIDGEFNSKAKFKGQILLHDFSAGISFANASIKFIGNSTRLDINSLVLNGNILGGDLKGYFDYKEQFLLLKGQIAPVPSAFSIFLNLPLIKQLGLKKLTTINTEISGKLGALKYNFFTP